MIKLIYLSAVLSILLCCRVSAQSFWEYCDGAPTGQIFDIAVNARHQIFVGDYDGIYRSDDGKIWHRYTKGLTFEHYVGPIAIDSNDDLLAMSWPDGLYRSTDNGQTWKFKSTGLPVEASAPAIIEVNAIACDKSGMLFVGTPHGLYRSINNAANWVQVDTGLTDTNISTIAAVRGKIFVGTRMGGLFASRDSGMHWEAIHSPSSCVQQIMFDPDGACYILSCSDGLFRSRDSFWSWQHLSSNLDSAELTAFVLAEDRSMILSTYSHGTYKRFLNDTVWNPIDSGLRDSTFVVFTKTRDGKILGGTYSKGVYQTSDFGRSWSSVGIGGAGGELCVSPAGRLFSGTNKIIYSDDDGDTWNTTNSLAGNILSFCVLNSQTLFACTDQGLLISRDSGINWTSVFVDSFIYPTHVEMSPEGDLFGYTWYAGVYRSTDTGASWKAINNGFNNLMPNRLAVLGKGVILACTWPGGSEDGMVYRSTDNGDSWNSLTMSGGTGLNIFGARDRTVYLGSDKIYYSTDVGTSWKANNTGITDWTGGILGTVFAEDSTGSVLLSVSQDGTYRLTGSRWVDMHSSEIEPVVEGFSGSPSSFAVSPRGKIFASAFGVYRTISSNFGKSGIVNSSTLNLSATNSPNPFSDKTTFHFTLPSPKYVRIVVYDNEGREIAKVMSGEYDTGEHEATFDAEKLPPGVYFYRLTAGAESQVRAIVKE